MGYFIHFIASTTQLFGPFENYINRLSFNPIQEMSSLLSQRVAAQQTLKSDHSSTEEKLAAFKALIPSEHILKFARAFPKVLAHSKGKKPIARVVNLFEENVGVIKLVNQIPPEQVACNPNAAEAKASAAVGIKSPPLPSLMFYKISNIKARKLAKMEDLLEAQFNAFTSKYMS